MKSYRNEKSNDKYAFMHVKNDCHHFLIPCSANGNIRGVMVFVSEQEIDVPNSFSKHDFAHISLINADIHFIFRSNIYEEKW